MFRGDRVVLEDVVRFVTFVVLDILDILALLGVLTGFSEGVGEGQDEGGVRIFDPFEHGGSPDLHPSQEGRGLDAGVLAGLVHRLAGQDGAADATGDRAIGSLDTHPG